MILVVAGFALGGCYDKGAGPVEYCKERIQVGPDGRDCSARYLACEDTFGCSYRVDCTVDEEGFSTCTCAEDPTNQGCRNLGRTWTIETDLCHLLAVGEHEVVRYAGAIGCFGDADDSDFSRIPD